MSIDVIKTKKFRQKLEQKSREELLRLIKIQDPATYDEVMQIEDVFRNKMSHLTWNDGSPITERDLSIKELALLIDEPFTVSNHLLEMGITAEKQKELHIMSDPVTWCKTFLKDGEGDPIRMRAYQTLVLRDESTRKVMRWGRRLGKSTSMTMLMLHKCVTNTNYKVVVVAPMIKHVKVLYDELVKLIENNPYLAANTNRYVASPSPELDFATGSTIRFFTSGVKSGGRSDSTRGQEADLIILDELDYMHPDDLIAILAMLQDTRENQNKKILVGASTPSGAHEVFYNWCTQSTIFKQFYFPSYVNPMWTSEMEEEQRQVYRTANSYKHEIEADWGDNEEGVYPRRYLDVAFNIKNNWEYKDYATNDSDYFIGVDWDKYGAGTNICVLEKYPKNYIDSDLANKFRIAYREETPREEFTYLKAVERIIELNRNFNPKYIYVDRGAGEVQVEMLHDAGKKDPFSGLGKKVKGISFKEIIELRNPFTNLSERKETKPFMVDNLYRFFENEMLMIPHEDNELYHQLLSYILVRTSQNGNPVFDTINDTPDHAHDALLLACLAFTENYGEFFNVNFNPQARVLSNKFFMPTYTEVAGSKEEKVSTSKAYEPPDEPISTKNKLIARPMSYNVRGGKAPISRRGF